VPFALLKMPDDAEVAVVELAMSFPGIGEIDHLASILEPHVAVVLNVLPVHLEFLKTVDNVARGKLEIFNHLAPGGVALLNGDFDQLHAAGRARMGRTILFGRDSGRNDVVLEEVAASAGGTRLVVGIEGHRETFAAPRLTGAQVENLFAAVVVAWQAGLPLGKIRDAVAGLEPVKGRGVISEHLGVTLVDDTYNANPEAVKKLLRWAAEAFPQPRVAVLGDMLELGDDELVFHAEVGRVVAELGYDLLVTVGRRARALAEGAREAGLPAAAVVSFDTPEDAGAWLEGRVHAGTTVLFKASRGVALERAIAAFTGQRPPSPASVPAKR
jgi:UDP-N-acetylmuramoyl-tripeptide--D-alanyl-D-alanine ligase